MKRYINVMRAIALVIPLFIAAGFAVAADQGSITIITPQNGAVLASGAGDMLEYNVHLSPNGNHLHVYIDNQSPIIDRNVSHCPCTLALPPLTPGSHTIAVREATADHVLTGVHSVVTVKVK